MEYLKQVAQRLAEIVRRMSVSQVIMLVAIVAGSIVGMIAISGWVGKVSFQPLYSDLEPSEAGEITKFLGDRGIPYELSSGGTTIKVPEAQLYQARIELAAQGMPNSGTVGYSIFDETNLGMTDFLQKLNFRRALEGELARTISSLDEVKAARVHIVIPEQRLFAEQQQDATASVVLKLAHSGGLSKSQLSGITNLVASSVEGLRPQNITIVDYSGTMLSGGQSDELVGLTSSQLDMTQAVERDLTQKAQSMLDGVLGPGKSIVRVTAELNFDQYSRVAESYDPNSAAVRSEQRTETNEDTKAKSGENAEDEQTASNEVTVTNYELSKTIENQTTAIGTVKRLSVAVLLDGTYQMIENAENVEELVYEPRPQDEIDRLTAIVKNAVGFSPDRNDQLEIVNIAFDKTYLTDQQDSLDQQYMMQFYLDVAKKVGLVLLAIAALIWVRGKLKKFFAGLAKILPPAQAPVEQRVRERADNDEEPEIHEEPIPEIKPEKRQPRLIDQMQKVAKKEPDEIAKVIRTMMVE